MFRIILFSWFVSLNTPLHRFLNSFFFSITLFKILCSNNVWQVCTEHTRNFTTRPRSGIRRQPANGSVVCVCACVCSASFCVDVWHMCVSWFGRSVLIRSSVREPCWTSGFGRPTTLAANKIRTAFSTRPRPLVDWWIQLVEPADDAVRTIYVLTGSCHQCAMTVGVNSALRNECICATGLCSTVPWQMNVRSYNFLPGFRAGIWSLLLVYWDKKNYWLCADWSNI